MTLIEKNWEKLFEKYQILDNVNQNGFFQITATQINEFKEARLMTKFDHKANLPNLFSKNKLSILPVTRGSYVIGNFDTYQNIHYNTEVENIGFSLPSEIESIDYNNLYSESSALHCAYVCGIIDDVVEEKTVPTLSGRMSTSAFDFQIRNIIKQNTYSISVNNSQCEIDGGYESLNRLLLVEAKNFTSDDFLIRQLYYPYRLWQGKVTKEVIPAFMTYSNDVFSIFIYKFNNPKEYNSLELVKQKNYIIAPETITIDDIYNVLQNVQIEPEPQIPFPQADSFLRVIDLLGQLMENELTAEMITINYDFENRQTSYYTSAIMYLGMADKRRDGRTTTYFLNDFGRQIMGKQYKEKYLAIVRQILKHEVFNKALRKYFEYASPVTKADAYEIMKTCYIYNVNNESTLDRRAQSVVKWIEWILDLQD